MQYSIIPFEVKLPDQSDFTFDVHALRVCLEKLLDKRGCEGRIYALAPLLTIAVLAKLAGHNQMRAVAHWAKLQARNLTNLFDLPHLTMPHHTTWSRILGETMDINQFEAVIANFFC